jgi:hypothetical protein
MIFYLLQFYICLYVRETSLCIGVSLAYEELIEETLPKLNSFVALVYILA